MRLHSDFHDYYDSAIGLGIDPTVHFNRETTRLELDFRSEYRVPGPIQSETHQCVFDYIGYCGKVFPLVVISQSKARRFVDAKFFYRLEEVPLKELGLGRHGVRGIRQFFQEAPGESDKLFLEHNVPIWAVFRIESGHVLELNPRLYEFQFYRMKDAFGAFQDISSYLTNVLIEQKEILTIEDKYRIEQHGFDPKLSFRKEKKKG